MLVVFLCYVGIGECFIGLLILLSYIEDCVTAQSSTYGELRIGGDEV